MKSKIKEALRRAGAGYFSIEENGPRIFICSTRENGDIGREKPGAADIKAARDAVRTLRASFPDAEIIWETCDEWTHVEIRLPGTEFDEISAEILNGCGKGIFEALTDLGFSPKEIKETKTSGTESRIAIQKTLLARSSKFEEIEAWWPAEIELRVTEPYRSGTPEMEISVGRHIRRTPCGSNPRLSARNAATACLKDLEEEGIGFKKNLWWPIPNDFQPPAGSSVVGHGGYETPWEGSPFLKLPKGDYVFLDQENSEAWHIKKGAFALATKQLCTDFFPVTPEGAVPLWRATREITERIAEKILEEAKERKNRTLGDFGVEGEIFIAEDGSFHLVEKKK